MTTDAQQKVQPRHIRRAAYLYVRQSSMRQVVEHQESTKRQYALRQRAVALGWAQDQIVVIDDDLGQSGASSVNRVGFQRLVTEVGMGRAGIVMGLEVSRLARNSSDWHRLLEICALADSLILDEDGVYDPAHFNDRLVLGLKGTMSEAELHMLRARLRGGILNKARRGELWSPLPAGLVYDSEGRTVLDPDGRVQHTMRHFFRTFQRTGSATGTVRAFRQEGVLFPLRVRGGPQKGETTWAELTHRRALEVLHNPRYAGAFFFGRRRQRKLPDGRAIFERLPPDEWIALIPDAHPGYITWDEFEGNQRRLRENSAAHGSERRRSPPREGPALLQGLVICGKCGDRMTVRYHYHHGEPTPEYTCQRKGIANARPRCQTIRGSALDEVIGNLLLEIVTPLTLEVALAVERELQVRAEETHRLRLKHVERARYEAELSRRRYMQVDPDNRLVADQLEHEWNDRLRAVQAAQEEYERQTARDQTTLDDEKRRRIMSLATDFPRLWKDPATTARDRKRMVRLIIEDVTLIKRDRLDAHVRFRGGSTKSLSLPLPLSAWQLRQTSPDVVAEVDRLLDHHTHDEIAEILNRRGLKSGEGKTFHRQIVHRIQQAYGLPTRYRRLREAGMLTLQEMAKALGVSKDTVKIWRRCGLLQAQPYNDKKQYLYRPPTDDGPQKHTRKGLSDKQRQRRVLSNQTHEVQCET